MMEEIDGLEITEDSVVLDGYDLSSTKVTIHDVMTAGHCVRGAKRWFEEKDMDFRLFLQEGVSAHAFLSTRDGLAVEIVRRKIARGL